MMEQVIEAVPNSGEVRPFTSHGQAINRHHNYVARERHRDILVTRKGAVRARDGDLGVIAGSRGARSDIVRGKRNPGSFRSCSDGAGRGMSRGEAKRHFTVEDLKHRTESIECRKDAGVIRETPAACESMDAVMAALRDLAQIVHLGRRVVCGFTKGRRFWMAKCAR